MQSQSAPDLARRAFSGTLQFAVGLAVAIFLPAGTLAYWQGWIFWANFCGWCAGLTLYFLKHDPALVERRMRAGPAAEHQARQRPIQLAAMAVLIAMLVMSALDVRFGWSVAPAWIVAVGNALVAAGFIAVFAVFRENSFASAIIEVGEGQKVVSTGPYAFVRHPMYTGALLMFLGIPLALGSWWGLLGVAPLAAVLAARLLDEERYLSHHLPGYAEYCARVRYRLVPGVW